MTEPAVLTEPALMGHPQTLDDIMLQDTWTYRFHDPDDTDWTLSSYVRLADVSSVADLWDVHTSVQKRLVDGMFFVMREHVFPCWDDPENINGGCISLKVLKTELHTFWEELLIGVLGEVMLNHPGEGDAWSVINGISTSPKRFYCIVKIWLRDGRLVEREHFRLPSNYRGEVIYKSNSEMMRGNIKSGVTSKA